MATGDIEKELKDLIRNGQRVYFNFYRKGELYYAHENGFVFVVPVADTGDGVFQPDEKAILMMRYIRRQLAQNAEGKRS